MKSKKKIPLNYLSNPLHLLSLGFGSGLLPKAPGTYGTLAAIPVYLLLAQLEMWFYVVAVLLVSVAGVFLCDYTSKALEVHDHPGIVIDEFAGYFVTMIAAPQGWHWLVIGFLLFRVFDILKPWPISLLDKKVKGGLGIMVDDILAGVFALVCLQFMAYLIQF